MVTGCAARLRSPVVTLALACQHPTGTLALVRVLAGAMTAPAQVNEARRGVPTENLHHAALSVQVAWSRATAGPTAVRTSVAVGPHALARNHAMSAGVGSGIER